MMPAEDPAPPVCTGEEQCQFGSALTEEERTERRRRTQSRIESARVAERARMVWHMAQGQPAPEVAERLVLAAGGLCHRIKQFHAAGCRG